MICLTSRGRSHQIKPIKKYKLLCSFVMSQMELSLGQENSVTQNLIPVIRPPQKYETSENKLQTASCEVQQSIGNRPQQFAPVINHLLGYLKDLFCIVLQRQVILIIASEQCGTGAEQWAFPPLCNDALSTNAARKNDRADSFLNKKGWKVVTFSTY